MTLSSIEAMQYALRLAAKGLYTTEPNPRVGCVLVKQGRIVGEGWHHCAGEAHAEINALRAAGEQAKNSTAYITLEPCCHTGKTGPCSDALVRAGVKKVVAAMQDPNPLVAGKGLKQLQAHGVQIETGLLQAQAAALNPGFIKRMQTNLPFVRVKMAMSLDGRTAMASGESQWITGEAARKDVHKLRARSSAILTAINTVLQDDPQMNVRLIAHELGTHDAINQPMRVVLDSEAKMTASARLLHVPGDVLHVTAHDVMSSLNCSTLQLPRDENGLDLKTLMRELANRQVNELHVEAGATLAGSLLQQGLVDELVIYMAPHIMGDTAQGLFALTGMAHMKDRIQLEIKDTRMLDKDMRITATVSSLV